MKMMKQQFAFNDGSRPEYFVVSQRSKRYDSLSIQITKVLDLEAVIFGRAEAHVPYLWIYEEIDNDTDMLIYGRVMGELNIKQNYDFAKGM